MRAGTYSGDSGYGGLIECFPSGTMNSYCVLKTIEMSVSLIVTIFCCMEMYKQIKLYGWVLRWELVTILLMMNSLILNVFFCLWNTAYELYSLQSYTNNLYFVVIVSFVCYLYIEKKGLSKFKYGLIGCILIMGGFYTAIMIDSIVQQNNPQMVNNSCEQVWYLCINTICLALCIIALIVLFINQREQHSHMEKYKFSAVHVHNPMKSLWIWMGTNTAAQIIDLIQTGLLLGATPKQNCMVLPANEIGNNILMFSFAILTMVSGYIASLWYYAKIRRSDDQGRSDEIVRRTQDIHRYSEDIKIGNIELLVPCNDDS